MRVTEQYKNIGHTLQMLGVQVRESLDYAEEFVPMDTSAKELFWILRQNVVYVNDPPGVELLQSMPSLFEDNYHGIPGAGDCDCFTITGTACAIVAEIPTRIILVGDQSSAPTHIYNEVWENGQWKAFDLVNPFYDQTKKYKYKRIIEIQ